MEKGLSGKNRGPESQDEQQILSWFPPRAGKMKCNMNMKTLGMPH